MALTGTDRGTGGNNTPSLTVTMSPNANYANYSTAMLCISYDNAGAAGADPYVSIGDSLGNTWSVSATIVNNPVSTPNSGAVIRVFSCTMSSTPLTTSTIITITFNTSVTAKAISLMELNGDPGFKSPVYSNTGQINFSGTNATRSVAGNTVGQLIIGVCGGKGHSTITGDSDTFNGTWSAQQTIGFGAGAAGQQITTQRKVQTTTGSTQTYNIGFSVSCVGSLIIFRVAGQSRLSQAYADYIFLD